MELVKNIIFDHFSSFFGYLNGHMNPVRLGNIEGPFKRSNLMTLITFLLLFLSIFVSFGSWRFLAIFHHFRLYFGHFGGDHIVGMPLSHSVFSKIVINGERHLKKSILNMIIWVTINQVGVVKNVIFHLFGPFLTIFWIPEGSHESSMARKQWSTILEI